MRKKKQNVTDIFVRGRKLTLGIKLVGTFAITYYSVYFVLLSVFGFYYRSVYDPAYSGETMFQTMFMSAILWLIVGMLVVSLILLFRRKRYGKYLFMIFTVVSQIMACSQNYFNVLGIGTDPAAGGKKSGLDIMFLKDVKQNAGILIPPGRIESKGNLFFLCLYTVNG